MSEPIRPGGSVAGTRADSDSTQLLQPEPDTGNLPVVPADGPPAAAPARPSAWAPGGGSGRVATPAPPVIPAAAPGRSGAAKPASAGGGSVGLAPDAPGPVRRSAPDAAARRGPRRARLAVKRVDPWSVLKFTFVFSLALLIVLVVAVAVLYAVLEGMGVFDSINVTLQDLTSTAGGAGTVDSIQVLFSFNRIVGGAALLGAINVVLVTALATLAAFLYNLCADLVGGLEVTLSERE